ncbi:MAG: hypothetical protein AAF649_10935 [Verrucomicrobiota bacterium]
MKFPIFAFIALTILSVFFLSPSSHGQDKNVLLDAADIKLEEQKLPARARGDSKEAVKEYGEDWWAIDIKFSTEEEITEEIEVKVYLAAYDFLKDDAFVVLTAEETFINVLQGSNHRATFYLHPGSARRFGGDKGIASFGRSSGDHNVHVEIFEKGRLVAEMDMKDDDPNWFREGAPIPDVLLGVKDTPWWPFESLAYNQIKEGR